MSRVDTIDEEVIKELIQSTNPKDFIKYVDEALNLMLNRKDDLIGADMSVMAVMYAAMAFGEARATRLLVQKVLEEVRSLNPLHLTPHYPVV